MEDDAYKQSLTVLTIDQLTAELQKIHDQLDILFTMNNSLDDMDITEGGGDPAIQAEYQKFIRHQKFVTEEVDKRHILEAIE